MPGSEKPTGRTAARIEVATWALIFGGLAVAGLGLFVDRQPGGGVLGATLVVAGLVAFAIGVVLIVVRARMGDATAPKVKR